jgi:cytidine deaminase
LSKAAPKTARKPQGDSLFEAALAARERSYSRYSGFRVGAAIELEDGRIFSGCNVENSSYGGTVCAERVAVWKAVSELGPEPIRLKRVVVATEASPPWPPCGLCRQIIGEFASAPGQSVQIQAINLRGEVRNWSFEELFPDAFTPDHLVR